MIKKTTATYTFSFIFFANILSEAAKNVEVFPQLLRRIATNQAGKTLRHSRYNGPEDWNESGTHGSLKSPVCSCVSITLPASS